MQDVDSVNIYDILEPCYYPESSSLRSNSRLPQSFRRLGETKGPHKIRKRQFGWSYPLRLPVKAGRVPTWPSLSHALFDSENVPCTVCSHVSYPFDKLMVIRRLLSTVVFLKIDQTVTIASFICDTSGALQRLYSTYTWHVHEAFLFDKNVVGIVFSLNLSEI